MIFSEQRSDTDLLNDLEGGRHVYLVGCPACANMSLYIKKAAEGSPVMTITPTGFKAVSMTGEVDRLSQLLVSRGLKVNSWIGKYPIVTLCVLDEGTRNKLSAKCKDSDTVVAMCCDAGTKSLQRILAGKRVIAGMKAKGIVNAKMKRKMGFAKFLIDRSTVDILQFTLSA